MVHMCTQATWQGAPKDAIEFYCSHVESLSGVWGTWCAHRKRENLKLLERSIAPEGHLWNCRVMLLQRAAPVSGHQPLHLRTPFSCIVLHNTATHFCRF
mmetsp:Transcript_25835/g.41070  ORF Transcript_25835/g.41070 Transcript_25835/m.41070 type:complete len:99 (-) Transcript_25835:572-868(-)